jgi:predicted nucleic acid-binding protein
VKLSTLEPDSGFYAAMLDGRTDLSASVLSLPECRSALVRKMDGGEIIQSEYAEAWKIIEEMLSGHSGISVLSIENEMLERASDIIEQCHGKVALRTLDAIHIAACMCANAYPLVTNDKLMRKAAEVLNVPLAPIPTLG